MNSVWRQVFIYDAQISDIKYVNFWKKFNFCPYKSTDMLLLLAFFQYDIDEFVKDFFVYIA